MRTIEQLKEEIAKYETVELGCIQVLTGEWDYKITDEGEVLFIEFIGDTSEHLSY